MNICSRYVGLLSHVLLHRPERSAELQKKLDEVIKELTGLANGNPCQLGIELVLNESRPTDWHYVFRAHGQSWGRGNRDAVASYELRFYPLREDRDRLRDEAGVDVSDLPLNNGNGPVWELVNFSRTDGY